MSGVIVAPETRDLPTLAAQLAAWVQTKIPAASDIQVLNLSYPLGAGQSHETILFDLIWTEGGGPMARGCVVRIKPTRHTVYPDDLFDAQCRLIQLLHNHGKVRVAAPIWFEADPTLLGAPFYVMEKMLGRVAVSHPPYAQSGWVADATPKQRATLWNNGVRQLAAIQSTPLAELGFLRGPANAPAGLAQEWDKFERFRHWVSADRAWPILDAAFVMLKANWPKNQPQGLVWGDARLGNMMFNDDFDVVAVMDWEQPSLGGALHDLAWWLVLSQLMHTASDGKPLLEGFGARDETIALWQQVTGISVDDIEWYEDFTWLKIACLEIRINALRGKPAPDQAMLAKRLKL
jgi:aminoglycoside phosphotransferase (APT) family kinase protein